MRPWCTARLLFSLALHSCTTSSVHAPSHPYSSYYYKNSCNSTISRRSISIRTSAATNNVENSNTNKVNDDEELWQLYGHPANGVDGVANNNNNENNQSRMSDKSHIRTNAENVVELNKEANMNWKDAINAYEAECYAHPSEPNEYTRLNLLHCIEDALQLPCTRREKEVCSLWRYALQVHTKAISHSFITVNNIAKDNSLHETLNEIKILCNILYFSQEYVQCVAFVNDNLATLEKLMETNRSSKSSSEMNECSDTVNSKWREAKEGNETSWLESKYSVKTILALMEIVSVYLMSLSQHEPWTWEVRSDDDYLGQVFAKTIEHDEEKEVMTRHQTSSKIQRVCQLSTWLLEQTNNLLHNNFTSEMEENCIYTDDNIVVAHDKSKTTTSSSNNNFNEKQVKEYVKILVSVMEWLLFHPTNETNEMVSGVVELVSHKVVEEWRNVLHLFPFAPTSLLHENAMSKKCNINNKYSSNKNELMNKTPLSILQYVHQLPMTTWQDWTSLVHVYHYVLQYESTWPLYRIFELSITIGNKLISCNTPWINSWFKQQSVSKARQEILTSLGTSMDVKALVLYGTLPINKKSVHRPGGKSNENSNKKREEECKYENVKVDAFSGSLAPYDQCLSIVCSMSGLEAYKGVHELLHHTASNEEWAALQEKYGDILTGHTQDNWRTALTRLQTQLAEGNSRQWRNELPHTLRLLSDANKINEFLSLIREYNMMESKFIHGDNNHINIKNSNLCVASSLAHVIERSGKWWCVHEVVSLIAHASLPQNEEEEFYLFNACIRSLEVLAHAKKWKEAVQLHMSLQEIMPHESLDVLCCMLVTMPAFSSWRSVLQYVTSLQHSDETECKWFDTIKLSVSNNENNNGLHHLIQQPLSSTVEMYNKESKKLQIIKTDVNKHTTYEDNDEGDDEEMFIRNSNLPEPYLTHLLSARGKVNLKEINNVQVRRRSLRLLSENGHWECIYNYITFLTHKDTNHHQFQKAESDNDTNNLNNNITTHHSRSILSLWSLLLFAFMHCDLRATATTKSKSSCKAVKVFNEIPLYNLAMNNVTWLQTAYVVALDHGWLPELLDMLTNISNSKEVNELTSVETDNHKRRNVVHLIQEYIVLLKYELFGVLPEKTFVFTSTYVTHMLYSLIGVCNFLIRVSLPYNLRRRIVEESTTLSKHTVAQELHVSLLSVGALPPLDAITQSVANSHNTVEDAHMCSVNIFVSSSPSSHMDARALVHVTELKTEEQEQLHHEQQEQELERKQQEDCYENTVQIDQCKGNEVKQINVISETTKSNVDTNTKQVVIIGYKPPAAEISNVARGLLHQLHHLKLSSSVGSFVGMHKCIFYTLYYLSPASHGLFVLCSSTVPRLRFEITLLVRMSLAPIAHAHVALLSASFYSKYRMKVVCEASDESTNTNISEETWAWFDSLSVENSGNDLHKDASSVLCTDKNDVQQKGNSGIVTVEATCTTCQIKSMNNVLHNMIADLNSEGWGLIEPDCGVGESLYINQVILRDRLDASNVIVTE